MRYFLSLILLVVVAYPFGLLLKALGLPMALNWVVIGVFTLIVTAIIERWYLK